MKVEGQGIRSLGSCYGSADSTREDSSVQSRLGILKSLGVKNNNICSKSRAMELNTKLAKFFLYNAIPFNLIDSEELADFVKAVNLAYYQHGLPSRFWMGTTGVDLVYEEVDKNVEEHLRGREALLVNMDGWENEKKQQLKIITETCVLSRYM